MSSFAGVSVLDDGKLSPSTTTFVKTSSDCGYHLLVIQDYARTKKETPTGDCIASRDFGVGGHRWSIEYYPNGERSDYAGYVSIYLCRLGDDDDKHVQVMFDFGFIDDVEWQNQVYIRATERWSFPSNASSWGYHMFIPIDALERSMNLEEDDCFTIRCDMMVCNTQEDDAEVLMPDIHHNLKNILHSKVGSDVTFEVDGEMFDAHRCVLAAQSKVFMAQLFGPMKETSTVIHIKDMEADVFRDLLSFIYTSSLPDLVEEIELGGVEEQGQEEENLMGEIWLLWMQKLFVAADRYDLQRLKFICEKQLIEYLGVSSVASTLVLADRHYCQGLKEACFKFIQVQSPSCLQTAMETVAKTYPSILDELIALRLK